MAGTSSYRIELAAREHLPALPEIEVRASERFPSEDIATEMRAHGLPLSFFEKAQEAGRLWTAVWEREETPVGFAVASMVDGAPHLFEMDVLEEHGRKGLGARLVLAVADWARSAGFESLTLTTFRHLPWNAPFYARLGFEELLASQCGPELKRALREEVERGLDPAKRVAMRLRFDVGARS